MGIQDQYMSQLDYDPNTCCEDNKGVMYEDPAKYSSLSADYVKDTQSVMEECWGRLSWSPNELLLDVGCGSGDSLVRAIKPAIPHDFRALYGIDISPTMIDYANSNWNDPRIKFRVMDISTKKDPFLYFDADVEESGGFDKIVSFYCMQWVKDRRQALKNLYRMLRPGGTAVFLVVVRNGLYKVWDKMACSEKWYEYFKEVEVPFNDYVYMEDYTEVFCRDARQSGFLVDYCQTFCDRRIFPVDLTSIQEVSERLRSIDPLVRLLSTEDERQGYMTELLDTLGREVTFKRTVIYSGLLVLLNKPGNMSKR